VKARESGMPEEQLWASFFDPEAILSKLGLTSTCRDAVEVGCGYGTFTIPAARIIAGTLHAFDIERDMIEATRRKAGAAGLSNVRLCLRDVIADGFGLPDADTDYVMLFNILHCERPEVLLAESYRVLRPSGRLGIIHWKYDPTTPRGPSMEIRPRPEQCQRWAEQAGFGLLPSGIINLPPYHYGMALRRSVTE
jgi:ubiquinone/menaquinone biosynthesis C-methylase UbiE